MSHKKIYIYRIEMGNNENSLGKDFCYARNAHIAVEEMKKIHNFKICRAVVLGEADISRHPEPFELMPEDEKRYLNDKRGKIGEKYSARPSILSQGTFVPIGEMDDYERNFL